MGILNTVRVAMVVMCLVVGVGNADHTGAPIIKGDARYKTVEGKEVPKTTPELEGYFLNEGEADGQHWWNVASEILNRFWKDYDSDPTDANKAAAETELKRLTNLINDEKKKTLFEALNASRSKTAQDLITSAKNLETNDGKASRQELLRRFENPDAKFLATAFSVRIEKATVSLEQILAVLKKEPKSTEDQAKLAKVIDGMMTNLNKKQRGELEKTIAAELKKDHTEINKPMLQVLQSAVSVSLKPEAEYKDPFEIEFQKLYKTTLAANKRFHDLVAAANDEDPAKATERDSARSQLKENYAPEDLADYLGGQLNAKNDRHVTQTVKAVAEKDSKGNYSVVLAKSALAFTKPGDPLGITLGKTDEQINASITALHNAGVGTFDEISTIPSPTRRSGLNLFAFNRDAAKTVEAKDYRKVAKTGNGTQKNLPSFVGNETAGEPVERKFAQKEIPSTPAGKKEIVDSSSAKPNTLAAELTAFLGKDGKCFSCHKVGARKFEVIPGNGPKDVKVQIGTSPKIRDLDLTQFLAAAESGNKTDGDMNGQLDKNKSRESIQSWVMLQTEAK